MPDAFTALSFTVIHLVAVRSPTRLTQLRTWTHQQLKAPADRDYVNIYSMCVSPGGDSLVLADNMHDTVKALLMSTGSLTVLYKETGGWKVAAALEVTAAGSDVSLLVAESSGTSKRVVVAYKLFPNGSFRGTHDITFQDETRVCAKRVCSH